VLPRLTEDGCLPEGVHEASLAELGDRFGRQSAARRRLFNGLTRAIENLREAGVRRVYVDGSFVTDKQVPNDVDGCWEANVDVDLGKLEEVFLDFGGRRRRMKEKYGVDFFPCSYTEGDTRKAFLGFFQVDKEGRAKGIVAIEL
jgi:hypothetical protein